MHPGLFDVFPTPVGMNRKRYTERCCLIMDSPSPEQIRAARLAAGLSQYAAAVLIKSSKRSWENWEQGRVKMHPGLFDYFLLLSGQKELKIFKTIAQSY